MPHGVSQTQPGLLSVAQNFRVSYLIIYLYFFYKYSILDAIELEVPSSQAFHVHLQKGMSESQFFHSQNTPLALFPYI